MTVLFFYISTFRSVCVCVQCPVWLFSVGPGCSTFLVWCPGILWLILWWFEFSLRLLLSLLFLNSILLLLLLLLLFIITFMHGIYKYAPQTIHVSGVQSGPKKCIHSLLINIFAINLNEISISGWECNWIQNSRTSLLSILLLYKYSIYGYRVIFFMQKCVYMFLGHSVYVIYLARQPPVGHGLLIHEVSKSHTTTHHIR